MCNLIPNERGGITYCSPRLLGQPEQRHAILGEVRMVIDGLTELCAEVRKSWPEGHAIPPNLAALLAFQDYALERVRSGELERFARMCEA